MTLLELNEHIIKLVKEIGDASKLYLESEYAYGKAKAENYLSPGVGLYKNQEMRDAAVSQMLEDDGLTYAYLSVRYKLKTLNTELDALIEIAKNIRSLNIK